MIRILTAGIILGLMCACTDTPEKITSDIVSHPMTMEDPDALEKANLPDMEFEKTLHDFGNVQEGEKVSYAFKFKNVGKSDLIINNAAGSCGCTVPTYPEEPIPPGETAYITAEFDSRGRPGLQDKTITVITNAIPNTQMLRIKSLVIRDESADQNN